MAKTVFGMPGVGEKGQGGDAVAPAGAPGAQQGGQLPQKGGKEEMSRTVAQRPVAPPAAAPQPAPVAPQPIPAARPQPVAPVAAPMAKPAQTQPKPAGGGGAANRTMFGMPAMKLPEQGGAQEAPAPAPIQAPAPQAPAPAPQAAAPAPAPAPAPQAAGDQADAAFLKTQVGGAPPVSHAEVPASATAKTAEQPAFQVPESQGIADTGPIPASAGGGFGGGFESGSAAISSYGGGGGGGGYDESPRTGSPDAITLFVEHQDSYSRGELLLRSFFGVWYIMLPHAFMMSILGVWSNIINFIAWWAILFTGRFPQGMFEYQVGMMNWGMRVAATMYNLVDGYPAFWPGNRAENVLLEVPYPEQLSRGKLLLRSFLGVWYIMIPHGICLYGRMIATAFLNFIAWWAILFTGAYPEGWHAFNVGTLRWMVRLNLHMMNMTDNYPPFSGKEL